MSTEKNTNEHSGSSSRSASRDVFVEIVKIDNRKVVERIGPMSERKAERVERGALINLNDKEYFTRIVYQ